jgi:hypothetical protein
MHTTKIFLMAALALMTAACSNDDNDIQTPAEQPAKSEGIPFTATISLGESASTRALTENGTTIEATWATGEKVALIYKVSATTYLKEAEVTPQGDGTATISTTLDGSPVDDTDVTIVYPASAVDESTKDVKTNLLASQNGLLTGTGSIAEKYELRKTTTPAKLKIDGTTASLKGTVSLTNQNAIFKLTLKDIDGTNDVSATSVVISDQTGVVTTVTPASGFEKVMYVALPTTATTLKFLVTGSDSKKYFNMASSLSLGASYYQSTVKLATVGDVILSTGKCAKAGTGSPVAMIAYLGNASNCTNGLAIQLNASSESMNWSAACSYSSYPSITGNPGTWRLPSKADWQNMFVGCAKSGDAGVSDSMDPIAGFKEKIGATGITWQSVRYWSSTDSGSKAWDVSVRLYGNNAKAYFSEDDTSNPFNVLGCLAF